jgi:hypothetical protein
MKRLLLALTLATGLSAEPVYLTAHGKMYHQSTHCMSLSRAKQVYTADRAQAEAHGLKPCSICYRKSGSTSHGAQERSSLLGSRCGGKAMTHETMQAAVFALKRGGIRAKLGQSVQIEVPYRGLRDEPMRLVCGDVNGSFACQAWPVGAIEALTVIGNGVPSDSMSAVDMADFIAYVYAYVRVPGMSALGDH